MRKYTYNAILVRTFEQLYEATSAVLMNCSMAQKLTVSRISVYAREELDGNVRIGCKNVTNLSFASDIDALAEKKQEPLLKVSRRYKMGWSSVLRRPN